MSALLLAAMMWRPYPTEHRGVWFHDNVVIAEGVDPHWAVFGGSCAPIPFTGDAMCCPPPPAFVCPPSCKQADRLLADGKPDCFLPGEPGRCPVCGAKGLRYGAVVLNHLVEESLESDGSHWIIEMWRCEKDGILFTRPSPEPSK